MITMQMQYIYKYLREHITSFLLHEFTPTQVELPTT